jgi:digeranylgeranylglycerophospholipid reductase
MTDNYDVVIAGAGPAGGQCARDLAARNYDVLVLEAEGEDEFPAGSNKSTAGTFPSTMSSFGIPDEVVMNYTEDVVLESPNNHYVRDQPGAVLEFADYKQWLVADSREDGAEYRFDARATRPIRDDDGVIGVAYNGDEEVYADVVIDATGPAAPLARKLDVCNLQRERQAIGVEYELRGIDIDHPEFADLTDAMMLRLDHDLAPGGYSWVFHTGGDEAKVGVCYIQNESHRENARDDFRIDDYLSYWMDDDPRFENAERIEGKQHRGSAHIQLPDSMSTSGFLAIGDTVPTVDPLWGEGIDKCMRSGRAAAATVDRALTVETDTSAEAMAVYDDLWHTEVAPNMRNRLLMTELLYRASNDRYDRLMRDLHQLADDTLQRANDGNLRAILNLLTFDDVPLVASLARDLLRNTLPGASGS